MKPTEVNESYLGNAQKTNQECYLFIYFFTNRKLPIF